MFKLPFILAALLAATLLSLGGCATETPDNSAQACFSDSGQDFGAVLGCYRREQANLPLQYQQLSSRQLGDVEQRRFSLQSQDWSPRGGVQPATWRHGVEIYIPSNAIEGKALLIVNNGINTPGPDGQVLAAGDFSEERILAIVRKTRTIAVSVSDVPNQYLRFTDEAAPRREDSLVARSWAMFLQHPQEQAFTPMQVPMMQVVSKTMDLAEQELKQWKVRQFLATGASKRAWALWLTTIADPRIGAIVPLVLDFLNMGPLFEHTYRSHGGSWPLAFTDYHREGITGQRHSEAFGKLQSIIDPLRYLDSPQAQRLAVPKYIVNVGNDEFFLPDNSRFYFDQLPGEKTLRIVPNQGHGGIRTVAEEVLTGALARWQAGRPLPQITARLEGQAGANTVSLELSEEPVKLTQWTAVNPQARDFRLPCAIKYVASELCPSRGRSLQVPLVHPAQGWAASFVEATFGDGLVATTPVYVLPDSYPQAPSAPLPAGCSSLADTPVR